MSSLLIRSLHDLGAAAWFGGSLMGAVGLNGATSQAHDPAERTRLSSLGWAAWAPVQTVAIGAHLIGGVGELLDNRNRVKAHGPTQANSVAKTVLTAAAMGVTAYSGALGKKVADLADEGAEGATEPSPRASSELKAAQQQLKYAQWAIPALAGAIVVLGAQQGEQQRGVAGLFDRRS